MRIKITTLPPLPPLKAWYLIPTSCATIGDLKICLQKELEVLKGRGGFVLEVDGFEVLGGSGVGVLREEDVVCIKLAESSTQSKRKLSEPVDSNSKKRKTSHPAAPIAHPSRAASAYKLAEKAVPALLRGEKRKRTRSPVVLSSSSESSGSEESESESSSEEDSSSSESSASSSSSSSRSGSSSSSESSSNDSDSSDDEPDIQSTSKITNGHSAPAGFQLQPKTPSQPPVPPGHGSKSTKERNLRRRASRAAHKTKNLSSVPPAAASTTASSSSSEKAPTPNLIPTAAARPDTDILKMARPQAMNNKNKRKGFLAEMKGMKGQRIVWSEEGGEKEEEEVIPPVESLEERAATPPPQPQPAYSPPPLPSPSAIIPPRTHRPRIIPPSEIPRELLPPNLIITSVTFPGMGEMKRARAREAKLAKKAGKAAQREEEVEGEREGGGEETQVDFEIPGIRRTSSTEEEEAAAAVAPVSEGFDELAEKAELDWEDWEKVAKGWEGLRKVQEGDLGFVGGLGAGSLVGWKAVELDLTTYTPEVKLKIGTLFRDLSTLSHPNGPNIGLKPLKRPLDPALLEEEGWDEEEQGNEAMEQEEEEEEEEEEAVIIGGPEVLEGDWRVIARKRGS